MTKSIIWIKKRTFRYLDLYFARCTWRLKPPSKKLTSYIFNKQTPEQILHIHKDMHASTESTECLPLCVPVLNCWLAELPEDVSGCSSRSGGASLWLFSCQINDAGGLVVCRETGSITAGVLCLLAQCFSCAPLESFLPAPQSLPVTQLQINYTL